MGRILIRQMLGKDTVSRDKQNIYKCGSKSLHSVFPE